MCEDMAKIIRQLSEHHFPAEHGGHIPFEEESSPAAGTV
jgi:hypothetical protein